MAIQDLAQAKQALQHLSNEDIYKEDEALSHTDQLIALMDKFPELDSDEQGHDMLCKITDGLYSIKQHLPSEKQVKLEELFRKIHHIQPKRVSKLLDNHKPAESLLEELKDCEAVIRGRQQYPVPTNLLKGEKMPCDKFFLSTKVNLGDGSSVRVCQGLLAHYSATVRQRLEDETQKAQNELDLKQLDRHQCDTLIAFLETEQEALINSENALPILKAAASLQIPKLIEVCSKRLLTSLDDEKVVELINLVEKKDKNDVVRLYAEKHISEAIGQAIIEPDNQELQNRLHFFQKNLSSPISIVLSGDKISDKSLEGLTDFPIEELTLMNCENLNKNILATLGRIETLNKINLIDNAWVDDEALKVVPKSITSLSIELCSNFTGEGLRSLAESSVKGLSLSGCKQLKDEDFSILPKLEELDISFCTGIGELGWKRISEMDALKGLNASKTSINNTLATLLPKNLERLDLSGCPLDDGAMEAIDPMKKLEELLLNSTEITDKGLKKLPDSIQFLSLNRCLHITDGGVKELAKNKNIRAVFLRECPNVTESSIQQFNETVDVGWSAPQPSRQARKVF